MTMKLEEIKVGAYVNWRAERYFKSWDIVAKIVKFEEGRVTLLGFDDFRENEVSQNTVMEECKLLSSFEVEKSFIEQKASLQRQRIFIETEYAIKMKEVDNKLSKLEELAI